MLKTHRKKVKLDLKRAGQQTEIRREGGGTENYAGKITGSSYNAVTDSNGDIIKEYLLPETDSFQQNSTDGGTYDTSHPTLLVAYDSIMEEGDRVDMFGTTYQIESVQNLPTHKVVETVNVDG